MNILTRTRANAGLSKADLAKRSNVSVSTISRIENEHIKVSETIAGRLAMALSVDVTDLQDIIIAKENKRSRTK